MAHGLDAPNRLRQRGIEVTPLGFGSAPIGGLYASVTEEVAIATVDAAWESGVRFFDTAPLYGMGLSEQRLGRALAGRERDEFVLATKVGRLLRETDVPDPTQLRGGVSTWKGVPPLNPVFDFSYDGALRSLEESLERLQLSRVDIVHIHDPDAHGDEALAGAYRALVELREQGVVGAIGAGMNQWQMLLGFAQEGDFDCFLLAGRYTLLDHSALGELLPKCTERGIRVIAGGVYNSGILANPRQPAPRYDYGHAPREMVERALALADVCHAHRVPLQAAAIQFPLAHPAVECVVVGARSPQEAAQNGEMFRHRIAAEVWSHLKDDGLIPADAPTP